MRAQLHRAIVARAEEGDVGDQEGALRDLRAAFARYAATQSAPPAQLATAWAASSATRQETTSVRHAARPEV